MPGNIVSQIVSRLPGGAARSALTVLSLSGLWLVSPVCSLGISASSSANTG